MLAGFSRCCTTLAAGLWERLLLLLLVVVVVVELPPWLRLVRRTAAALELRTAATGSPVARTSARGGLPLRFLVLLLLLLLDPAVADAAVSAGVLSPAAAAASGQVPAAGTIACLPC